jgi:hypothetical protein
MPATTARRKEEAIVTITKIIIASGELNIGDATEQDCADYRAAAVEALSKAFPEAAVEVGRTDSAGSVLRLESDDEWADISHDEQYAAQVLERM